MSAGSFYKDPSERYPVGVTMHGKLPAGRTVTRATVSASDLADDSDATTAVLARTSATVIGAVVQVGVKAGTLAHRYKLLYTIYDDANDVYRESLIMIMKLA